MSLSILKLINTYRKCSRISLFCFFNSPQHLFNTIKLVRSFSCKLVSVCRRELSVWEGVNPSEHYNLTWLVEMKSDIIYKEPIYRLKCTITTEKMGNKKIRRTLYAKPLVAIERENQQEWIINNIKLSDWRNVNIIYFI